MRIVQTSTKTYTGTKISRTPMSPRRYMKYDLVLNQLQCTNNSVPTTRLLNWNTRAKKCTHRDAWGTCTQWVSTYKMRILDFSVGKLGYYDRSIKLARYISFNLVFIEFQCTNWNVLMARSVNSVTSVKKFSHLNPWGTYTLRVLLTHSQSVNDGTRVN